MKKIMTAALGLSLLSGGVMFAQNTMSNTDTGSMKSTKKSKKHHKKSKDTMSTMSSTTK